MKYVILKQILVALFIIGAFFTAPAQTKETAHIGQTWLAYLNQTRLSDKWGIWSDVHLRTKESMLTGLSQGIIRAGLTYYVSDDLKLTGGYAFVNHFPGDNHRNISQPEHRPWQQIQWHTKYPKFRLAQYIRLEERWRRKVLNDDALADGYLFNFRLRYNIMGIVPLNKKRFQQGTLSFVLNDELHINFGKQVVYNYFDQNRFFTGINYHVNKHDNLQFGYMSVFLQLGAGNRYRSLHTARIFYFHNLDLRSK